MTDRRREEDVWDRIRNDLQGMEEEDDGEWDRIPCSDGSCIGILGDDGCCRVCGREHPESYISTFSEGRGQGSMDPVAVQEGTAAEEGPNEGGEEPEDGEEPGERILCSDESCIGLVGEDGYCKLCGLLWRPEGYGDGEPFLYKEDLDE
jgi:hypothetical protein